MDGQALRWFAQLDAGGFWHAGDEQIAVTFFQRAALGQFILDVCFGKTDFLFEKSQGGCAAAEQECQAEK